MGEGGTKMSAFVKGVRDILPAELEQRKSLYQIIREVFSQEGYQEVITPTLESIELYSNMSGLLATDEMFKVVDEEGQILVLRPDVTMPITRMVATRLTDLPAPYKFYYITTAYQSGRNQSLDLREKTQAGVELIGRSDFTADLEIIALLLKTMQAAGIKEPLIDIGQSALVEEIIKMLVLTEDKREDVVEYLTDKNSVALKEFIEKEKVTGQRKKLLERLPNLFGQPDEVILELRDLLFTNQSLQLIDQLERLFKNLRELGLAEYITFDPMLMTGQGYYTGVIFQGYARGSNYLLASGGRYDNLAEKFGESEPAVGFAVEIDNIISYLYDIDLSLIEAETKILITYQNQAEYIQAYQKAESMRQEGLVVEILAVGEYEAYQSYRKFDQIVRGGQ